MPTLEQVVNSISALDKNAMQVCQDRWNAIAHPLNSLGKMEKMLIHIAGITGNSQISIDKKALVVFCADNGVVEEGVTQTGQEVTAIVSENFLNEKCTAAIMCKSFGVSIYPIDIGIARDTALPTQKIAYGTKNFTKERAMTIEDTKKAIQIGIDTALLLKEKGYEIIATGEMGIGNTTTSAAIATVLLNETAENLTGRGAGLSDEGLNKKINAIKKGIALHNPNPNDAIDVLSAVGGLDIAGLTGVFLGCAYAKIPVVIDGVISSVAALCAKRICSQASAYMIPSHVSKEPCARLLLNALELEAGLQLDLCLGEGTGALLLFPILDCAVNVYTKMSSFEQINIENYVPQEE